MAGGMRYESLADMPPGMREQVVSQVLARVIAADEENKLEREKEEPMEKEMEQGVKLYCNGKGGYCDKAVCPNECCEHYNGSGAVLMQPPMTVADRFRSRTDGELVEMIMDLHLRMCDPEFDISELWCRPGDNVTCSEEYRTMFCDAGKRRECILRYLRSKAEA